MIPVDRIVADLRALGVRPGDLLMVHASLRAVGPVDGRADGVIAAIDRAVGADGTWLMMIDAEDDHATINHEPEDARPALLADAVPFDPLTTPAARYVGALAEAMRVAPGTVVSDQPEGRFAARGADAPALVADVPWDHYYGAGSPLARLVDRRGSVLRLGADPDTMTLLHLAEERCAVAPKRVVRRHRRVAGPDGPSIVVIETFDDSNGIVDHPGEDYFTTILRSYLATGRAAVGPVGAAPSELIDATDLVPFAITWMEANLRPGPA